MRAKGLTEGMLNIKDNLDKRICDCEEKATNKETYREFIIKIIYKSMEIIVEI